MTGDSYLVICSRRAPHISFSSSTQGGCLCSYCRSDRRSWRAWGEKRMWSDFSIVPNEIMIRRGGREENADNIFITKIKEFECNHSS